MKKKLIMLALIILIVTCVLTKNAFVANATERNLNVEESIARTISIEDPLTTAFKTNVKDPVAESLETVETKKGSNKYPDRKSSAATDDVEYYSSADNGLIEKDISVTDVTDHSPDDEFFSDNTELERTYAEVEDATELEGSYAEVEDANIEESIDWALNITYGTAGRLIIPDLGIDVALNQTYLSDGDYNQYVTDLWDSAAWFWVGDSQVVSDHDYQGFNGLYAAYSGCVGYVYHKDGTCSTIQCGSVNRNAWTDDYDIYDNDNSAFYMGYDVVMYTCNPSGWPSITVTYWNYQ